MSSTRVTNTAAPTLLVALLLFATLSHAQRSGGASLRIRVNVVKLLSTSARSASSCLPIGGGYMTLNESALPPDCSSDASASAEPPVLMVRATLPVSLPFAAQRSASRASGDPVAAVASLTAAAGTPCQLSQPSLSAWKNELSANTADLCTATVVPD
jgi:hypothetical protein